MKQSARVHADACVRRRKCVCVLAYMHTFAVCMFVHRLTCIKAITALLLDSSFKLPLKIKINMHLYLRRISFVLVSIGCIQRCNALQTSRLTSEELSQTDPKSFQAETHDGLDLRIGRFMLHCQTPALHGPASINPVST